MSRLSQMIWYLNQDKQPSQEERATVYTGIKITDALKRARREYRQRVKGMSGLTVNSQQE